MSVPDALVAGRYRLVSVIATGGMGVVWEAWDGHLERSVAIKQLRPLPGVPAAEAELAKSRAMREARITARLHHPHAVPVFDAVEHEGQPCLVMPLLPSAPLSAMLRERGPLPLSQVSRIGAEVAAALAAAHALGIVHRDVKPGNILIMPDGAAHISDFGISHAMGDATLTSTALVHGTPAYLAPEVARGESASFPSDVFSLGSTLYAALEGAPPFGSDPNSIALLHKVAAGRIPPPEHAGDLTAFLLEMLSPTPGSRPTMEAVASFLAAFRADSQVAEETAPVPEAPTSVSASDHSADGETTQEYEPTGAHEADVSVAPAARDQDARALPWWVFTPDPRSGGPAARSAARHVPGLTGHHAAPGAEREPVAHVEPESDALPQWWRDVRADPVTGSELRHRGEAQAAPGRAALGEPERQLSPPAATEAGDDHHEPARSTGRPHVAAPSAPVDADVATSRPPAPEGRRRPSPAVVLVGAAVVVALFLMAATLVDTLRPEPPEVDGPASAQTTSATQPSPVAGAEPRVLPTPRPADEAPSASTTEPEPEPSTQAEPGQASDPENEAEAEPPGRTEPELPGEADPGPQAEPDPGQEPEPQVEPEPEPAPQPVIGPVSADRSAQLAAAITDYYALMPANTEEAWPRMTADYQTNHAGGFASYENFWDTIADVAISDVQATPPDQVVATLTYTFHDGRVDVERTAYRLVDEGGVLKIAATQVLSSRSG